jgi:hypothetical protein
LLIWLFLELTWRILQLTWLTRLIDDEKERETEPKQQYFKIGQRYNGEARTLTLVSSAVTKVMKMARVMRTRASYTTTNVVRILSYFVFCNRNRSDSAAILFHAVVRTGYVKLRRPSSVEPAGLGSRDLFFFFFFFCFCFSYIRFVSVMT